MRANLVSFLGRSQKCLLNLRLWRLGVLIKHSGMAQASGPAVANRAGEMPGSRRPLGLARPFQARAAARPGVWQVCSWPGPGLVPGPRPGSGSGPAWPLAARPPALPGCWGILEHNLGAARFCVFITYTTHNTHITQESRDHQRRSALRGRESEEEEQRGSSSVRRLSLIHISEPTRR